MNDYYYLYIKWAFILCSYLLACCSCRTNYDASSCLRALWLYLCLWTNYKIKFFCLVKVARYILLPTKSYSYGAHCSMRTGSSSRFLEQQHIPYVLGYIIMNKSYLRNTSIWIQISQPNIHLPNRNIVSLSINCVTC